MPSIRSIASLAASLAVGTQALPLEERQTSLDRMPGPYLNVLARQAGKLWFGTAADIPGIEQNDVGYMTYLNDTNFFGEITPANYMKWQFTEPEQNVFNYTGGNVVVNLAKARGKQVRCHNLVWESELPTWVTSGTWTNATLTAAMINHIKNLVTYWGDSCYSWDVVNEALNSDGSYASDIFLTTIGPAYVPIAFKAATDAANAAGLKVKLFYNDYGIENPGTKANAVIAMAKNITAYGGRIDGVGLESHFEVSYSPSRSQISQVMNQYLTSGTGITEVAMTELDVRFVNVSNIAAYGGFSQQAKDYYNSVGACIDVPACIGVTVWDFDDTYSWIPSTFAGQGLADILDANFTRKPAFTAIGEALAGTPCTVC